jgi:hypothetical protein
MNNDLISREALKKAIEQGEGISWDSYGKDDLCVRKKYIDNAPTVDLKDIYQEGYYDGHLDGYTKAINEERPQGKADQLRDCDNCVHNVQKGESWGCELWTCDFKKVGGSS